MTAFTEAYGWRGRTVVDRDGEKIGKVRELYLDWETNEPEWALVQTGVLGTKSALVPLTGAAPAGEDVRVAHTKDQVMGAPGIEPDAELSQEQEAELYEYYGLTYSKARSQTGLPEGTTATGGPPGSEDAMTRSEEELRVGTSERERGRARLRKYVETEDVQETVPLRREEARVEREPITGENIDEALRGPEISEAEHEVTLREEEPVVEKRTVPKERVRLTKEAKTGEEQVSEQIRKERIDVEERS